MLDARLRRARRAAYGWLFDRLLRVDTTSAPVGSVADGDRRGYEPSEAWRLSRILPPAEVGPDDVFVDVGTGKGRVLLVAARRYRARRIIGVEVDPELLAVARRNVARLPARSGIELVGEDVSAWKIPPDATILYLFNPFVGRTFEEFLAGVLRSQADHPRRIRLVYANPVMHDAVLAAGFRIVRTHRKLTLYTREA
ncbi:methyltransferase domain-containing protein [Micromonospora sp. NPDC047074]|uniref:methyltransferase domain-containing protein n=1 Tax=Micromonospora sp. NPDC047074 TaxID=3154339 RepID=UPI0033C3FDFA